MPCSRVEMEKRYTERELNYSILIITKGNRQKLMQLWWRKKENVVITSTKTAEATEARGFENNDENEWRSSIEDILMKKIE